MENVVTAGLCAALETKVVIGGQDGEDLPLDNAHMHTFSWQIHEDTNEATQKVSCKYEETILIFVKNLTGRTISLSMTPLSTVEDVKRKIWDEEGINVAIQKLLFCKKDLRDNLTLAESNIHNGSTLHLIIRRRDCLKIDEKSFDSRYNYKYPPAGTTENFRRGKRDFQRPLGWEKYAIKVLGKYESDAWIGSHNQSGEWPVSYHGTDTMCTETMGVAVEEIARGKNFAFGRGMYSVPNPDVAERYSTPFVFEGVEYKMIFMNRLNPEYTREVRVPTVGDYFVTSDENQIRAYAILVKKVES